MKFKLVRCIDFKENGIGGVLIQTDGSFNCVTLELPWRNNERNKSCIPAGNYSLELRPSKFGIVPEILSPSNKPVFGRDDILIHYGNTINDTNGCILVGNKFGVVSCKNAVLNSRLTLANLLLTFEGKCKGEIEIVSLL